LTIFFAILSNLLCVREKSEAMKKIKSFFLE
jgi:hypothetical protein